MDLTTIMLGSIFKKSEFNKHVLTLITGTAVAQVIPIFLSPVLRRIITLEEYAVFEVYFRIISILAILAAGRYPMAIVLPKTKESAENVLGLSCIVSIAFNLLLMIPIALFGKDILTFINIPPSYLFTLYWIPLGILLITNGNAINFWFVRQKAFTSASTNKVIHKAAESSAWLISGLTKLSGGLIYGDIIGRLIQNIVGWWQCKKAALDLNNVSIAKMKEVAKTYYEYPTFNAIPAVLNTCSLMLPVIIINKYFDASTTSNIGLAIQILGLPLALISTSVSQVFYERVATLKKESKRVLPALWQLFVQLLLLGISGVVVVYLFAPTIFTFVYGNEYIQSGIFAQILVVSIAIKFAVSPLSMVFPALDKIKIGSLWQAGYFCIILILFQFVHHSIEEFLYIYVGLEIIAYVLYLLLIVFAAKKHDETLEQHI